LLVGNVHTHTCNDVLCMEYIPSTRFREKKSRRMSSELLAYITPQPLAPLLKEHYQSITTLRKTCADALARDGAQYDDELFLLRYILSHDSDLELAAQAIRETITWREENKAKLERLGRGEPLDFDAQFSKYSINALHKQTKFGAPLFIVRAGLSNPTAIVETLGAEKIKEWFIFSKEILFQICDRESRRRNMLVKAITIIDMKGAGMSSQNSAFQRAMGEASKITEQFYPQLLGISVLNNPPFWFRAAFAVVSLFMSAKTLARTKVCYGKTRKEDVTTCPFVSGAFDLVDLPSFLGGQCRCGGEEGACVAGRPNDMSTQIPYPDEEAVEAAS
jgi:hypothetical protein